MRLPLKTFHYLFSLGFRPFFLMASLYASWSAVTWILLYTTPLSIPHLWSDSAIWHAHEMIFGYTSAVIAGFLLTAVPNWTKVRPIRAWPLILLTLLWLAGRILMHAGATLPWVTVAIVDVLFLPVIGIILLKAVIKGRNTRNYVFFLILGLLTILNTLIHATIQGYTFWLNTSQALHASVFLIILMITVFGGRVIPIFTRNALKVAGTEVTITNIPALEKACPASVAILACLTISGTTENSLTGCIAFLAGFLNLIRMSAWKGHRTLNMPIVWILHAGYSWISIGLITYGLALLAFPQLQLIALHILTIGGIGTTTLAMMTRVSLGHTGHQLKAAQAIVVAYLVLQTAVLIRIIGGLNFMDYSTSISLSGIMWSIAFGVFSIIYLPILLRPRADERPD